jgi:hypothetical protein
MNEGNYVLAYAMYKELAQYVYPKRKAIDLSTTVKPRAFRDVSIAFI